jgi:hypothetical protein
VIEREEVLEVVNVKRQRQRQGAINTGSACIVANVSRDGGEVRCDQCMKRQCCWYAI